MTEDLVKSTRLLANLECKVVTSFPAAKYVVYLAEAVAYRVNEGLTPIAWHYDKYFSLDREAH